MAKPKLKEKIYTLEELGPRAFENAFDKWRDGQEHNLDTDFLRERFMEDGEKRGFEVDVFTWKLFTQGAGAAWTGRIRWVEFLEYVTGKGGAPAWAYLMAELAREGVLDGSVVVTTERRTDVEWCSDLWEEEKVGGEGIFAGTSTQAAQEVVDQNMKDITELLLKEVRAFADEFYKAVEEEYEHQTSEKMFREQADANDWRFNEDGRMV